jgi:hypothetical protein
VNFFSSPALNEVSNQNPAFAGTPPERAAQVSGKIA